MTQTSLELNSSQTNVKVPLQRALEPTEMLRASVFPSYGIFFYLLHLGVLQEVQRGTSRTDNNKTAFDCAAKQD